MAAEGDFCGRLWSSQLTFCWLDLVEWLLFYKVICPVWIWWSHLADKVMFLLVMSWDVSASHWYKLKGTFVERY